MRPAIAAAAAAVALGGCGQDEPPSVQATEYRFEPAEVTVELDEIEVVNAGDVEHALAVTGPDGDIATDVIEPGETAGLTVDLPPGTYDMYCPVDDHRSRGMEGTVTVAQASGGEGGGGLGY